MYRLRRETIFPWLVAAVVSLPALLYAVLGMSSRLMGDDFGVFATALHLSGWHNFDYWWNSWYSSYTFILFNDVLAPLGPEYIAQAFPSINIFLWFLGFTWLFAIALHRLELKHNRWSISIALAALTIAAAFTSFQTWESIFWYAASVRYVLPVGIVMIYLAFAITVGDEPRSRRLAGAACVFGAVICFINAGFSELHAALQLIALSLAMPFVLAVFKRSQSRPDIALLAAGWLGSGASLLLQFLNPGWSARLTKLLQTDPADPVRSLPELFAGTISTSFEFISYPAGIPSLLLMIVTGMAAVLLLGGRNLSSATAATPTFSATPYRLGLAVQLFFAPLMWRNTDASSSYPGHIYGVATNALLIGAFLFALWRRRQIEASLATRQNGLMLHICLYLGTALALMAMTQLSGAPVGDSAYLFISALVLLGILAWQLHRLEADARSRRFGSAAAASVALALAAWALPVLVGQLSLGFVFKRTLVVSTLIQILCALVWGGYLGFLIGRSCSSSPSPSTWISRIATVCMLLAAIIIAGMILMQVRLVPAFQTYAHSWDARHRRIVQLRASGESEIDVAPLRFDLSEFIAADGRTFDNVSPYFYGVDSIDVLEVSQP